MIMNTKSYIEHYTPCFWTATINSWLPLFYKDRYKEVVIGSLRYLSQNNKVHVFAFVIMPTHIHLLWQIKEKNGRESPQGSFLKYTAHQFKKMLKQENTRLLNACKVSAPNKNYEFWKSDSLAIPVTTTGALMNILSYIHNNPMARKWRLCNTPEEYRYSSAAFYEQNDQQFPFLKNIFEIW